MIVRKRNVSHWGAFTALVKDGRLVGVEPFDGDRAPSVMLQAIPESVQGETRVRWPMVRQGYLRHGRASDTSGRGREPFVRVPWDRALDLVAGEIARVREDHGPGAIFGGSYGWSSAGRFHHARTQLRRFLYAGGGCTDQVTNYSYGAAMTFLPHVLGDDRAVVGPLTPWDQIARHTRLMVMFGGASLKNGQVESGGMGAHVYEAHLHRAVEAGVRFVNVSPVHEDAPRFLGAEWIPIRPNTDTALMLACAHTLLEEGRHDRAFVANHCTGFERFAAYLTGAADGQPKDASWAAAITEVGSDAIRALARRMAEARTMLTATWSLQRAQFGEQPYWALIALASMLGQVGLPGGGFGFGYGSINGGGSRATAVRGPELKPGRNPANRAIPVARIADMLLHPGGGYDYDGRTFAYPDVKMIYWCGGNPFHHHQDLNRLVQAWHRPETVVVHEPWWTATARMADVVLPATTTLERNDLGWSSRDRFVLAMHQAIAPVGESRNDFDIFAALGARLGIGDKITEGRDEMGWLRHLYRASREHALSNRFAMPPFEEFWSEGFVELPESDDDAVLYGDFRADPVRHPLRTPSGRIELYSETIAGFGYDDCPPHPTWLEPKEWLGSPQARRHPLHLISNQPSTRLHSQMDSGPVSRAAKVAGREPVWIHPRDAARRGIADGRIVRLYNDRGACLAGAVVTDRVRPGVVQLASGAWYDPVVPGRPGSLDRHGNPNVLTPDIGTSRLGQGPSAMSTLVEVEPYLGEAPPVSVFRAPA